MFCPYCGKHDGRPKLEGCVMALARLDCPHCGASVVIENQKAKRPKPATKPKRIN